MLRHVHISIGRYGRGTLSLLAFQCGLGVYGSLSSAIDTGHHQEAVSTVTQMWNVTHSRQRVQKSINSPPTRVYTSSAHTIAHKTL